MVGLSAIRRAIILGQDLGSVSLNRGYPLILPGWWKGRSHLESARHSSICLGSWMFIAYMKQLCVEHISRRSFHLAGSYAGSAPLRGALRGQKLECSRQNAFPGRGAVGQEARHWQRALDRVIGIGLRWRRCFRRWRRRVLPPL